MHSSLKYLNIPHHRNCVLISLSVRFSFMFQTEEEFEDTKGAIRNRISKKNRQHNGQQKKDKRTNNDQQNMHIKLNIE